MKQPKHLDIDDDIDPNDKRVRVIEYPIVKAAHVPAADGFYSLTTIAERWHCSLDTVSLKVVKYRGQDGFIDLGSKANLKTHKRKYSVIKISTALLAKIEKDLGKLS